MDVKQKHTLYQRKSTKKIVKVSPSDNNYSSRIITHSTTTSTSTIPHEVRGWTGPGGENVQNYTATFRSIPLPRRQALSTFPLTSKMCLPLGRPDRLAGVRPQERVQRHAVEHVVYFVRVAPSVQFLDASCGTSCISSTRSRLTANRLSKCPRSCLRTSLCELLFAIRSWRTRLSKCDNRDILPRHS